MGIYKSYKRRFQLKRCNQTRLEKRKKDLRNKTINEITKCLAEMDKTQLQAVYSSITRKTNYQKSKLISMIEQLPDAELLSTINLISTMRYSKGPNEGKIYSPYLQKKANDYIDQTLYKHQSYQSLQDSNSQLERTNKKLCQKN